MHRLLRLQHHKHTGKLLHHRHTSWRTLAVLLLVTGGVLVKVEWGMHQLASADSIYVTATVPAPNPTQAAVITYPTDGSNFTGSQVTVLGTCQVLTPAIIVAIYDNGILAGSVACSNSGTFSLPITLYVGANTLIAKSLTVTGGSGPDSAAVQVTYTPPVTPQSNPATPTSPASPTTPHSTSHPSNTSTGSGAPLDIYINEPFIIFGPHLAALWTGDITGGMAPYALEVAWGDGQHSHYTIKDSSLQHLSHPYSGSKPYSMQFTATDSAGNQVTKWFAAVTPHTQASVANILAGTSSNSGVSPYGLLAIYSTYLTALCVFGIIWIKERRHFAYAKIPVQRRPMIIPAKRRNSGRR